MRFIVVCLFLFVLFSCSGDEDHRQQQKNRVIAEAKPFIVPTDSIEPPQVIPFNEKVLKKTPAGIPSIVMANTNVSGVVESQEIVAGPPVVCIPGTGLFKNPELLIVESVMVSARQPEVVEVRNLAIKDRNSASIGYFSKLQGLKHDIVSCVFQDRTGNLWFGTGGGVTRYDGKSFTHYTIMEGLSNDHVKCILEDRSGNIWLGTDGGGVSKFNGRSFRNIPLSGSPLGNSVSCMLEDQMGVLWFGTLGG
ncbi:MAG: two-component regulator propeller domain-containing protein, partial [Flavobacteriales bacterium]